LALVLNPAFTEEISNKYFGVYKEKPNEKLHKYKEK